MQLQIPNTGKYLVPGDIIRIGRFSDIDFEVQYGWYTWGGNRPFMGWSLRNLATGDVKPIQSIDLIDVYMISHAPTPASETVTLYRYAPATVYRLGQLLYYTIGQVYQAARDFTSCDTEEPESADFAADIAAGNLIEL